MVILTNAVVEPNQYFFTILCLHKKYIKKKINIALHKPYYDVMQHAENRMRFCLADSILQCNYNDHKYVIVYIDKTPQVCRYHTDYTDIYRLSNRVKK